MKLEAFKTEGAAQEGVNLHRNCPLVVRVMETFWEFVH